MSDWSHNMFWNTGEMVVEQWDVNTGQVSALITNGDARLPAELQSVKLGGIATLPDGGIFVRIKDDTVTGWTGYNGGIAVHPDNSLNVWKIAWSSLGYSDYAQGGGIFDPGTGITWLDISPDNGGAYVWGGFDLTGGLVAVAADDSRLDPGNAQNFIGVSFGQPSNPALIGKTLYRWGPTGDNLNRINLDTGAWEGVGANGDPADQFMLVGVAPDLNYLATVNSGNGWLQVRNVADQPWTSVYQNGGSDVFANPVTAPLAEYDPHGPGGPRADQRVVTSNLQVATVLVRGSYAYYFAVGVDGTDYGWDSSDGVIYTMWGAVRSLYRMELTSGSITKLFDVPFQAYYPDGTITTTYDPAGAPYWTDNSGEPYGLTSVPDPFALPPTIRAPLLRKYPLDIGRKYPPSKAQQYSGRRVGSYL